MMVRTFHGGALVGAFMVLIFGASTWWSLDSQGYPTSDFTGFDAAPFVMALALASGAAYGAALLSRGLLRRFLGALQFLLAGGSLAALFVHIGNPVSNLAPALTQLTGLSGTGVLDGWDISSPHVPLWGAMIGLLGLALSGAVGIFVRSGHSGSRRFETPEGSSGAASDPQSAWDELSRGADPTTR